MSDPQRGLRRSIERLYVYWLVSFLLLLALVVFSGLAVRGVLSQQQSRIVALEQLVAAQQTAASDEVSSSESDDEAAEE